MYINFLHFLISFFDYSNKKKVINFFKKKFQRNISILVDVGAHHGETIKIFNKQFKIEKILSFEASIKNFYYLHKKYKNLSNLKLFNFALGEKKKNIEFIEHYETQSSTIVPINRNSKYFKKKEFALNPFRNKNKKIKVVNIKMDRLDNILKNLNIKKIDILKIDTEGYDFNVIKGLGSSIKTVKYIYFEHHFHDMLIKNYNFSDINEYLRKNNFIKVFKTKMKLRKTFEYIYLNKLI